MNKELSADTNLSHYRILQKIGAGGMGEVYLAGSTPLGRKVAGKALAPDVVADKQARKRLVREARRAAPLDHPHICGGHEVGGVVEYGMPDYLLFESDPLLEHVRHDPEFIQCMQDFKLRWADLKRAFDN